MLKVLVVIDLLKLKSERMRKMLSQEKVAKALGMTRVSFNSKETGKQPFNEGELGTLLELLELKMEDVRCSK